MFHRSTLAAGFLIPAGLFIPIAATFAQDVSWTNAGTGAFTTGSNWSNGTGPTASDNALIGNGGTAQLTTGEAASVRQLRVNQGTLSVVDATVTTQLISSSWQTTGDLQVGGGSGQSGTLSVSGNSTINTGRVRIGGYNNGNDSSNVTGNLTMSGGSLTTANGFDFWLGSGTGSSATMNLSGSAFIDVQNTGTAGRNGASATATQTGTSHFKTAGGFAFGEDGSATWTVSDDAHLDIGQQANLAQGGSGNATVTVQNSAKFSAGGNLSVGQSGTAVLNVTSGTVTSGGEFWVGNGGSANGTVNLSGGSITSGSWVAVGRGGAKGTLNVSGGSFTKEGNSGNYFVTNGSVTNVATVNHTAGSITNTVSETQLSENTGNVTAWTASGGTGNFAEFQIARTGAATVTLSGTANYSATTVRFGVNGAAAGTLNLDGGTFAANSFQKGSGSATVNFNGGTVRARSANANFFGSLANSDLHVQSGGLKFDTDGNAVGITHSLSGVGGLTKLGAGELVLGGVNTYTGATAIAAGALSLGASNVIADASAVTLSGGTLNLNNFSETLAALTLGSTSTIDFGGSAGANSLTFADSSSISWTGSLVLTNFEVGVDTLSFSPGGLTLSQLGAISLSGYQATGLTGTGNVIFTAVPEPEHYALGATLMLGLLILARRRRMVS